MKKKIITGLLMVTMCLCLCSCGTSSNENAKEAENHYFVDGKELSEEEYNQYLKEQEEYKESLEEKEKQEETATENNEMTQDEALEEAENILDINIGDTFTLSDGTNEVEITLNGVDFQQEVHSTSDNMYQQYFADKDGESYIVMKLDIKNIGGERITNKIFDGYNDETRSYGKIVVIFDDKYNYSMQQLDTTSMVMSKYWSIDPLKSQAIYFVQSVPDEVIEKPYTITFSLVQDDTICKYSKN